MKKETIIHEFNPVIYPYILWVIVAQEPDIIEEKFNEYTGGRIVFVAGDVDRSEAFAMPVSRKENPRFGVVVFFRSKKSMSYNIIAHESSHAAKYLFDHIGADSREHEPFEYVVGWIAECCERVKNNKI